jgi:hypothetical protein
MRVTGLAKFGVYAAITGAVAMACASLGACEDEHRRSTPSEGGSGSCQAGAGVFPAGDCDPSDNKCVQDPAGTCAIDTTTCGDISCLPMAKNTGNVLDFRMRRLNIISPPSLTYAINPTLQTAIIDSAVDLKAKQCGEVGKGTFSWLLRLDKDKKTLTTGGAPPSADPFGAGYCFYNHTVTVGTTPLAVKPVTVALDPSSTDTKFATLSIPKLYVPIFLDTAGSAVIILPLTNPVIKDLTVSQDGNCIGSLNPVALAKDCTDVFSDCSKWHTAGSLGGFMTLKEADTVFIKELNQSLCVVLTQTAPATKCADASGNITQKGDFCSTTGQAGGCQDSFWLSATFAAAAIKINDGATTPTCQGGADVDAGPDSGPDTGTDTGAPDTGTDAGTDAPADASDAG